MVFHVTYLPLFDAKLRANRMILKSNDIKANLFVH